MQAGGGGEISNYAWAEVYKYTRGKQRGLVKKGNLGGEKTWGKPETIKWKVRAHDNHNPEGCLGTVEEGVGMGTFAERKKYSCLSSPIREFQKKPQGSSQEAKGLRGVERKTG